MDDAGQYFTWEPPGVGVTVRIRFDVIDRMNRSITSAFQAVPKRGLEIGGLLLGRTSSAPGGLDVTIEDVEEVVSEHRRGPSYTLSQKDKHNLERSLRTVRRLDVVGFFRSHTRSGLYLDEDDNAVAQRYFGDPGAVFLLVRPEPAGPPVAGFFYWEDGELYRSSSRLQFPFDSRALGAPAPASPAVAKTAETIGAPVSATRTLRLPDRIPFPPSWMVVAGLAVITLASGLWVNSQRQPAASFGLTADREGSDIRLSWNSAAVKGASGGALVVDEGARERRIPMTRDQLAAGTFHYPSQAADLGVRLEVDGPKQGTESLRIISAVPPTASAMPDFTSKEAQPAPPPRPSAMPKLATVTTPAPKAVRRAERRAPAREEAAKRPAPPPDEKSADHVAAVQPREAEPPPRVEETADRETKPRPAPVVHRAVAHRQPAEVSIEPAGPSGFRRVVSKIPGIGRLARHRSANSTFVPARAVTHAPPVPPPGAPDAPVDLRLVVDKEGRVREKSLVRSEDPALGELALASVDSWVFEPARVNDKPTESEVMVHFRFPRPEPVARQ